MPNIYFLNEWNSGASLGLVYFDDRGLIWHVDPWKLVLSTIDYGRIPTAHRMYLTANCSGDAYLWYDSYYPRVVFRIDGDPTYRVFPDNPTIYTNLTFHSIDGGVGAPCQSYTSPPNFPFIPANETIPSDPIVVPTLPYSAPLHPERSE